MFDAETNARVDWSGVEKKWDWQQEQKP